MNTAIQHIVDYYAKAAVTFVSIYTATVPPGNAGVGLRTLDTASGLVFPLSGSAKFTINGTSYVLQPGVVVHGGLDMTLDKEVLGEEPWRYALVYYRIPDEERNRFPLYNQHFAIQTGENGRITELLKELLRSYAAPDAVAAIRCKGLFMKVLEEMMLSGRSQLLDNNGEALSRAAAYIRSHYSKPVSIAELARESGVERRRFAYLFNKYTGMSPVSYLAECRIRRSKELLRMEDCPISQVAEQVGYTDSFYFSRFFKKQTGLSPSDYRSRFRRKY
jgi:AraC-like DNA-binding protein